MLYDRRLTLEQWRLRAVRFFTRRDRHPRRARTVPLDSLVRDTAMLGAGGVREEISCAGVIPGYDVIARWDDDRAESEVVLRDLRGHEWPLGYVDSRLPESSGSTSRASDASFAPRCNTRSMTHASRAIRSRSTARATIAIHDTQLVALSSMTPSDRSRTVQETQHETSQLMLPQHSNNLGLYSAA